MYTDDQWNNVMAFLNDEAEKPEPDGIGHEISTVEDFVHMLRLTEAINPSFISDTAHQVRELTRLRLSKQQADLAVVDLQEAIDNHPLNVRT